MAFTSFCRFGGDASISIKAHNAILWFKSGSLGCRSNGKTRLSKIFRLLRRKKKKKKKKAVGFLRNFRYHLLAFHNAPHDSNALFNSITARNLQKDTVIERTSTTRRNIQGDAFLLHLSHFSYVQTLLLRVACTDTLAVLKPDLIADYPSTPYPSS